MQECSYVGYVPLCTTAMYHPPYTTPVCRCAGPEVPPLGGMAVTKRLTELTFSGTGSYGGGRGILWARRQGVAGISRIVQE